MKGKILLVGAIFMASFAHSQSKAEFGAFLGASYYHGDINKSKLFYSPSTSIAALAKYNLGDHLAVGLKGVYSTLKGSDADFDLVENQTRNASFSSKVIDISVQFEFNFLPYNSSGYIKKNDKRLSPYVLMGIGVNFILGSNNFENPISIPFGLGIKYNIFERLTLGAEWSYIKTFNDSIDGVTTIQDLSNTPTIHNDDWYSFCGLFVTYKLFRDKIDCPTYL